MLQSMHKYAVKVDVDVATLQPFGYFLYRLPPWAIINGLPNRIYAFFAVKMLGWLLLAARPP